MAKLKPYKAGPTEKQFTVQVLEAARCYGITLERRNVGGLRNGSGKYVSFGIPGDPDWQATLPPHGRLLGIEVKRPGFQPTKLRGKAREHFLRQITRMSILNGQRAACWWVADVDDMLNGLRILTEDPDATITFDPDFTPHFHRS